MNLGKRYLVKRIHPGPTTQGHHKVVLRFARCMLLLCALLPTGPLGAEPNTVAGATERIDLTKDERVWVNEHPEITLGIDRDWRPYVFVGKNEQVNGIEPDLIKRINAITGLNIRLITGEWSQLVEQAKAHQIDGLAASAYHKKRTSHFLFSDSPYTTTKYMYSRSTEIGSMEDLAGLRVGLRAGNQLENTLLQRPPGITLVTTNSDEELISLLISGQVDAAIGGINLRLTAVEKMVPEIKIAFIVPDSETEMIYSIRKDWPELISIINKALAAIPQSERIAILEKWGLSAGIKEQKDSIRDMLTEQEIRWLDTHPIIVARTANFPPFHFMKDQKQVGYSVDLLDHICRLTGIQVRYVSGIPWTEGLEHVRKQNGKVDLLLTAANTEQRREFMAFSKDYLKVPFKIFTREDNHSIHGIEDLIGKTVAIEKGYALVATLRNSYPGIHLMETSSTPAALRAVLLGKADAYIGNEEVAKHHIVNEALMNLKADASTPFGFHVNGFGMRKDWPELASILNKAMAEIPFQEQLKLLQKWGLSEGSVPSAGLTQSEKRDLDLLPEERAWLQAHPVISLCVDPDWAPFEQITAAGNYEGIIADYIELISQRLGITFELIATDTYSESIQMVESGACTVLSSYGSTLGIEPPGEITTSYLSLAHAFVVPSDRPFVGNIQEIAGDRIGAVRNYPAVGLLNNIFPNKTIVLVDTVDQGLLKVASGELDVFGASVATISYSIQKQNLLGVKIGGVIPAEEGKVVMLVNSNTPILVSILNKAIDSISQEDWKQIHDTWFTLQYDHGFNYSRLWKISGGFILILALVLAWNHVIRKQKKALMQSEAKLKESDIRYRALMLNSGAGIIIVSSEGYFLEANPAFVDFIGYSLEELKTMTPLDITHPEDRQVTTQVLSRAWSDNAQTTHLTKCYLRKDGKPIWGEVDSTKVILPEGKRLDFAVITDITARKELEAKLLEVAEIAETANASKSEFLANMSHEIRTPMNAVLGFSEILRAQESDPKKQHYINNILTAGKSLLMLINDILDLSKVEAGKLELQYQAVSLRNLFQELAVVFETKLAEKEISLTVDLSASIPAALILDEVRVRQILINLISNAIKFTDEGTITLGAAAIPASGERSRVRLQLWVQDTGRGISLDQQQIIFDSFSQVEGQKTATFGGAGLGLAICRKLAELMGGAISVKSELGQGALFEVELLDVEVAVGEVIDSDTTVATEPSTIQFDAPRILIVDDVDYNREMLAAYLAENQVHCLFAENGEEAMELIRSEHPDIILLDMKMPVMNGYEVADILNNDPILNKIPVIAITASALTADRELLSTLCDGYLCKPVARKDLLNTLVQFLPYNDGTPLPNNNPAVATEPSGLNPEPGAPMHELRILLVEDNEINREMAMALLEDMDATIISANNGQEAVELVQQQEFSIVLMDLQMPVMDGFAATQEIRTFNQEIPIFAMSADRWEDIKSECLAAGMNGGIGKPINISQLQKILLG